VPYDDEKGKKCVHKQTDPKSPIQPPPPPPPRTYLGFKFSSKYNPTPITNTDKSHFISINRSNSELEPLRLNKNSYRKLKFGAVLYTIREAMVEKDRKNINFSVAKRDKLSNSKNGGNSNFMNKWDESIKKRLQPTDILFAKSFRWSDGGIIEMCCLRVKESFGVETEEEPWKFTFSRGDVMKNMSKLQKSEPGIKMKGSLNVNLDLGKGKDTVQTSEFDIEGNLVAIERPVSNKLLKKHPDSNFEVDLGIKDSNDPTLKVYPRKDPSLSIREVNSLKGMYVTGSNAKKKKEYERKHGKGSSLKNNSSREFLIKDNISIKNNDEEPISLRAGIKKLKVFQGSDDYLTYVLNFGFALCKGLHTEIWASKVEIKKRFISVIL
jgi:hypothetical protein